MPVKFNQYWTISCLGEKRKAYATFILDRFIPGINALGLNVVAGWSALVGAYSEISLESVGGDLNIIESALKNPKFPELSEGLFNYVRGYSTKILVSTGRKDSYSVDIRKDTIKFNQAWDIISEKKVAYENFVKKEFYPLLESMGIAIAGEWKVLIGDGPRILCEGRVRDVENLIKNLQSKTYLDARRKLKGLVVNFQSRILSFHIQRLKGFRSGGYHLHDL